MTDRATDPTYEAATEEQLSGDVDDRRHEAGFTFMELIVAVWLIGILSVIALGILNGRIEKAKLARCFADIRSIQSTVMFQFRLGEN